MSRCLNFSFLTKDKEFPDENEAPIDILPNELMIQIFKKLPLEDLLKCEEVSRRWQKVARDGALWHRIPITCSGQLGEIPDSQLKIINTHGECVRCIKIQYILNYHIIKTVTDKCKNLASLELIMCRLEKQFEDDVKKWHNLRKLNLKNSLLKSSKDLEIQYDRFPRLSYLGLSDFGLSVVNCASLLNCHPLSHILIDKIRGLTLEFIKELIYKKQDTLITLHVYGGTSIDDECLFLLADCPKLTDLAILRCEELTDHALIGVSRLKKINQLQLWNNTTFSEKMLMRTLAKPNLVTLRSLSLSKIENITPRIVDIISEHYKNLSFLALYQCPKIIKTDYEKQLKSKFRNIDVVLY